MNKKLPNSEEGIYLLHIAGSLASVTAFTLLFLDKTISSINIIQILVILGFASIGMGFLSLYLFFTFKTYDEIDIENRLLKISFWSFYSFISIFLLFFIIMMFSTIFPILMRDLPNL